MSLYLGNTQIGRVLVGPESLKPIAMRPDAELVESYTYDKWIVDDLHMDVPAYSTTAAVLLASENLTPTVTLDYAHYNYIVAERFLTIPTYSVTSKAKGRTEFFVGSYIYEIADVPPNNFKALVDGKLYTSRMVAIGALSFPRLFYWSSGTAVTTYGSAAYGTYQTVTAPTVSSGVLTVKSPAFGIRGHATYLSSTYFNAITDIRYQYVIDVWRSPRNSYGVDGWWSSQNLKHILDCVNTDDHTLT